MKLIEKLNSIFPQGEITSHPCDNSSEIFLIRTWFYEVYFEEKNSKIKIFLELDFNLNQEEIEILKKAKAMGLDSFHFWTPMAQFLQENNIPCMVSKNSSFHTSLLLLLNFDTLKEKIKSLDNLHIDLTTLALESIEKLKIKYLS